jgi:fatty-acyl-CoA synthase
MVKQKLASYRTLSDALAAAPAEQPFATMWDPAAEPSETTVTFGEFLELAKAYAVLYQQHGVTRADTIVLVMPQSLALMAAFAGAIILGAIPTILAYPTFKVEPAKYRYGLIGVTRNLRARLIVIDHNFPEALDDCVAGMQTVRLDPGNLPRMQTELAETSIEADDVAFIQHSAGTTGLQKGVALTHRSVLNQLAQLAEALHLRSTDRIVSWLPLYHDMGLIACFVLPLVAHLRVIMQSPTDWVLRPASFLRLISRHRATLCWLPNFAFQFMARRVPDKERPDLDLSSLRAAINCSEPVRAHSMNEFYQTYCGNGLSLSALQSSYAMAENTFAVTQTVLDGESTPLTVYVDRNTIGAPGPLKFVAADDPDAQSFVSSGGPLQMNQTRIVDDIGRDLPDAVIGEILVQSDSLFSGYYNRLDLTTNALREGWYWTKDRGFKLNDELFVLGRKDDLIIIGGKNIYPIDVEEIAWLDPRVKEGRVVAFGVDNQNLGTQDLFVVAELVAADYMHERQDIQLSIRRHITNEIGVTPRVVELVPPKWIVKSTAGKPARSSNRDKFFREYSEFDPNRSAEKENPNGK